MPRELTSYGDGVLKTPPLGKKEIVKTNLDVWMRGSDAFPGTKAGGLEDDLEGWKAGGLEDGVATCIE